MLRTTDKHTNLLISYKLNPLDGSLGTEFDLVTFPPDK